MWIRLKDPGILYRLCLSCMAMGGMLGAGVTLLPFLEHPQTRCVFAAILPGLEHAGLVKRRGKQRLDSTPILGLVSHLSRREKTGETIRLFLERLERRQRLAEVPEGATRRERYLPSEVLWHKVNKEVWAEKFQQVGEDLRASRRGRLPIPRSPAGPSS